MNALTTFIIYRLIPTSFLILTLALLTACGRQSEPTPETLDNYPRSYPKT